MFVIENCVLELSPMGDKDGDLTLMINEDLPPMGVLLHAEIVNDDLGYKKIILRCSNGSMMVSCPTSITRDDRLLKCLFLNLCLKKEEGGAPLNLTVPLLAYK